MRKAKFTIQDMLPIGITLVVLGIALAFGLQVTGEVKDDIGTDACAGYYNTGTDVCQVSSTNTTVLTAPSSAENATGDAITGVAKLPAKLPTIVSVVVAAIIIGILLRYLMRSA